MVPSSAPEAGGTPAVPILLAVAWLSIMVLLGSALFPALGWGLLLALGALTAVVVLGWRRANGSWTGTNSPERNGMHIRLGLALLPGWVFGVILAATADVWAPGGSSGRC